MNSLVRKSFFRRFSEASKVRINSLCVVLAFLMFVAQVGATTTTTNTNATFPVEITDGDMNYTCINFPVTGIPNGELVSAVTITFGIEHKCVSDVQMELRDPSGTLIRQLFGSVFLGGCPGESSPNFDINGLYTFTDTATQIMNNLEVTSVPPGNYRTANYRTSLQPSTATSLNALYGGMTSAQANGTWKLCARDITSEDTGRLKTSASIAITSSAPTAANVAVSGRVLSQFGYGISGAEVTLTDQQGNSRARRTNPFGYYTFSDVEAGQSYFISVSAKGHRFATQLVSVNETVQDLIIIGQ